LDLDFSLLPADYVLIAIDLDQLTIERLDGLPTDTVAFGDGWLASRRSPALSAPSAIVPESRNLILNVAHPDAERAAIASMRSFSLDVRLWR
ncbi:MAG: RES family NAD+ phosphorylase, partial [Alphaproteobacteria bacterium]|nr:RES family NAD+ phosphorylase [Alphaproteobacteria bacterium]